MQVAQSIRGALEHPFALAGLTLDMEASVGIAVSPEHGEDVETLLQHADVAMYAAKGGRTGAEFYDAERDGNNPDRLALVGDLRRAIERGELVLHYQPKASLPDGELAGVEALVRWNHPERGLVAPGEFVLLAEQTGLIRQLTRWVIDTALAQSAEWRAQGLTVAISVNLSVHNLQDPNLAEDIDIALRRRGASPDWLLLEITESAIIADPETAVMMLGRLAQMGIELAMDDYGTGYSALGYLRRLPLTELKIDRSFVAQMGHDARDAHIIRSTIDLGRGLGLRVVAEGVETEAEFNELADLGCDVAQGFFLAQPMPPEQLIDWIATPHVARMADEMDPRATHLAE